MTYLAVFALVFVIGGTAEAGCRKNEFKCNRFQCIPKIWVCDGAFDCYNHKDERNCPTATTASPGDVTPDPNFGAGCGSRKFEQSLRHQRVEQEKRRRQGHTAYVVGGDSATRGSLPWQVTFQDSGFHFCGGTIINKDWILTAAHCIEGETPNGLYIVAGDHKLRNIDGSEQKIKVDKMFSHPNYDYHKTDNDVALLKLEKSLVFDDYVQPACLPDKNFKYNENDWVIISGWGSTKQTNTRDAPNTLQVATVPIVSEEKCKQAYPGKITKAMYCAGKLGIGGTDTCQGDSGGPVVIKVNQKFTVVGIVSWGYGCAEAKHPGVYAKVTSFIDWISSITTYN